MLPLDRGEQGKVLPEARQSVPWVVVLVKMRGGQQVGHVEEVGAKVGEQEEKGPGEEELAHHRLGGGGDVASLIRRVGGCACVCPWEGVWG